MPTRFFAYYLPQYHPIPENDMWWSKGFTEWTNVTKALPAFKGHYQPRFPKDLGYYDLRLPEVREQQAQLARDAGIEGFIYYHYWFGNGRRLLERPFEEVLKSGKPDMPFMLCWANEPWKGVWHGLSKGKTLIEQQYFGKTDYQKHFQSILAAFQDDRYVKIDGKPVFHVYKPKSIPDLDVFVDTFQEQAHRAGLKGLYLLAGNVNAEWRPIDHGFDGVVSNHFHDFRYRMKIASFKNRSSLILNATYLLSELLSSHDPEKRNSPLLIDYSKLLQYISSWPETDYDYFPLVVPDWDNSARAGKNAMIVTGSTPELWCRHVRKAIDYSERYSGDRNIVVIKSWNEWAEGNYLEPDQKWGDAYLVKLREALSPHQFLP
jgi:hypothetical protein